MDAKTLRGRSQKEGIPQAIMEKDYVLSIVLKYLSEWNLKDKVVFKGGTAIKKIYFAEARFSEDLDFSVISVGREEIENELKTIFENKKILETDFKLLLKEKTSSGLRFALKFTSVLNYPQTIRFDFSFRENLEKKQEERQVIDYYNIGEAKLKVLSIEEILAEKIHALFTRTVARDLYDVWFLIQKGVKINRQLTDKKFSYYKEKIEVSELEKKINQFESRWEQDLGQFLRDVPKIEDIQAQVIQRLKQNFSK